MSIVFTAMPTEDAEQLRNGGADAYGNLPETAVSDGPGHPCRHCLANIEAGEDFLILAYRPFPSLQPYAETGPIFLHAKSCSRYEATEILPPMLASTDYIVRGYGKDNRIVYGTGAVTRTSELAEHAGVLLTRDDIDYLHVRSSRNNCYQCRIDRA